MKPLDTLRQADRHCDMEGLPPPSKAAQELDRELAAGRMTSSQAVRALVQYHKHPRGIPRC